jgi:hypothetical protein
MAKNPEMVTSQLLDCLTDLGFDVVSQRSGKWISIWEKPTQRKIADIAAWSVQHTPVLFNGLLFVSKPDLMKMKFWAIFSGDRRFKKRMQDMLDLIWLL